MTEVATLLSPETIKAEAIAQTGLTNFGSPSFEEPLAILCHSLAEEADLSEAGCAMQYQRLVGLLVQRLLLEEWIKRHPEILDEDISQPLFIVGLPRTGTTMLYRMLSAADEFSAPLHYEASEPAPALDWDFNPHTDARLPRAEQAIAAMVAASPELNSIYPFQADAPEESIYLISPALRCTSVPSLALVPTYHKWFLQADKTPAYHYLRRTLQMLQWQHRRQNPQLEPRRWLLKTPDHIHSLRELLQVFPDAKIIQTHRDPVKTIPSICSFISALHSIACAKPHAEAIGEAWCSMFAESMTRALEIRDSFPGAFHDVMYEDTVARPREVAERIFGFLGLPLSEEAWQEMEKWREANKREARPSHEYSLADFGLSEQIIHSRFADYRSRYI